MIVISKIDIPNKLTKGKYYVVISRGVTSVETTDRFWHILHSNSEIQDNELLSGHSAYHIIIYDDSSELAWYYEKDFLSLQEHRELNIDKILEDDKQF